MLKALFLYLLKEIAEAVDRFILAFYEMLGEEKDMEEEEEEEIDPELKEYQEYINNQIFDQYSNLSDDTENYWDQYQNIPGGEGVIDEGQDRADYFSESVNINDPRITDEQRQAIMEEIEKYGIDVSNVNFDVDNAAAEDFYKFNPTVGDRLIFAVTPWGEVISSLFTQDNMQMAYEVAEMEGKPVDDVVLEVMAERYNIANGLE